MAPSISSSIPGPGPVTSAPRSSCSKEDPLMSADAGQHTVVAVGVDDPAVQRGALGERPPEGGHQGPEAVGVHHLAVAGARRPRDVLVDQGAAEVVDARAEELAGSGGAHLDPAQLDVVDGAPVGDAAHLSLIHISEPTR